MNKKRNNYEYDHMNLIWWWWWWWETLLYFLNKMAKENKRKRSHFFHNLQVNTENRYCVYNEMNIYFFEIYGITGMVVPSMWIFHWPFQCSFVFLCSFVYFVWKNWMESEKKTNKFQFVCKICIFGEEAYEMSQMNERNWTHC